MTSDHDIRLEPARTVIEAFSTHDNSGITVLSEILGVRWTSVYRWQQPKRRGARGGGGVIPSKHFIKIKEAAHKRKIKLPWEILTGAAFTRGEDHG